MSTTPLTSRISPLPGQEDQSARLAASAEVGQVEGTIPLERCREAFLSFYCEHPQGRGLLRRYWNGYGFESAKAQKHWGIWLAACGFAAAHVNAAWEQGA